MTTIPDLLKLLFSTFPPLPSEDGDAQLAAYALALDECDLRDIEGAVKNFVTGTAPGHNPAFLPSASLVGSEVRRVRNLRLDHEFRTRRPALPPPDVERTPESRARVAAKMEQAVADLASLMRTEDAETARRRAAFQSRVNARFDPKTERETAERLGYTIGDPDADRGDMGDAA